MFREETKGMADISALPPFSLLTWYLGSWALGLTCLPQVLTVSESGPDPRSACSL